MAKICQRWQALDPPPPFVEKCWYLANPPLPLPVNVVYERPLNMGSLYARIQEKDQVNFKIGQN